MNVISVHDIRNEESGQAGRHDFSLKKSLCRRRPPNSWIGLLQSVSLGEEVGPLYERLLLDKEAQRKSSETIGMNLHKEAFSTGTILNIDFHGAQW